MDTDDGSTRKLKLKKKKNITGKQKQQDDKEHEVPIRQTAQTNLARTFNFQSLLSSDSDSSFSNEPDYPTKGGKSKAVLQLCSDSDDEQACTKRLRTNSITRVSESFLDMKEQSDTSIASEECDVKDNNNASSFEESEGGESSEAIQKIEKSATSVDQESYVENNNSLSTTHENGDENREVSFTNNDIDKEKSSTCSKDPERTEDVTDESDTSESMNKGDTSDLDSSSSGGIGTSFAKVAKSSRVTRQKKKQLNTEQKPEQSWRARQAIKVHPELPTIDRCHSYSISTKYTYRCKRCGYRNLYINQYKPK